MNRSSSNNGVGPGKPRGLVALAAALASIVLAGCGLSGDEEAASGSLGAQGSGGQPNIVMVVLDDATEEMIGPGSMPFTSQQLSPISTRFTNFVVPSPLCCPSRASLLTGQYGHNNGVLANNFRLLNLRKEILPTWLQKAGYRTMHVGKYLNSYTKVLDRPAAVPAGWNDWYSLVDNRYYEATFSQNGKRIELGKKTRDYTTTVINRQARRLAENASGRRRPFYLQVDHFAPHSSPESRGGNCQIGPVPARGDQPEPSGLSFSRRRSRDETELSDKPPFLSRLVPLNQRQRARIRDQYDCARASLLEVDRGIRRLVATLARSGELADTAIFVTSDNGYFYGEHRIPAKKEFPYEENLRMPLLVHLPGQSESIPPAQEDELTAMIDIAPTILELAGGDSCLNPDRCRPIDGRSMLPLLGAGGGGGGGPDWPDDRGILIEIDQKLQIAKERVRSCSYIGIRTPDLVFIRHRRIAELGERCRKTRAEELYDLGSDPEQQENLIGPGRSDPLAEPLRERMQRLSTCSGTGDDQVERENPCE